MELNVLELEKDERPHIKKAMLCQTEETGEPQRYVKVKLER